MAAVDVNEVVGGEGKGAQRFARNAPAELRAFFAIGPADVRGKVRLIVAIEAEQVRIWRGGNILQQSGGGAAFAAADFEDRTRGALQRF